MHLLVTPTRRYVQPKPVSKDVKTLLHILSGANVGATVLLPNGAFYIGKNVDCDIVLHDEYVAEQHVRILQVNSRLCVEVIAQPVWINGEKIVGGSVKLNYHDVVTVGLTSFCLGRPNASWSGIELPVIGHIEKPTAAEPVMTDRGPVVDELETRVGVDQIAVKTVAINPSRSQQWHLGLVIPVVLISAVLWFASRGPAPQEPLTGEAEVAAVQAVIDDLEAQDSIQVSRMNNGDITVSGYAQDYLEKQVIIDRVSRLSPATRVRIYDSEKTVAHTIQILSFNRLHKVRASSIEPGVVLLQGYESNDFRLRNTLQHIRSEVTGVTELRNDVVTPNSAFRFLLSLIKDTDIEPYLLLNLHEDRIWVEGTLPNEMLSDWHLVIKRFRSVYEVLPELVERVDNKGLMLN